MSLGVLIGIVGVALATPAQEGSETSPGVEPETTGVDVSLPRLLGVSTSGAPARAVIVTAPEPEIPREVTFDGGALRVRAAATWLGTGVATGLEQSGFVRERVPSPSQIVVTVSVDVLELTRDSAGNVIGRVGASATVVDPHRGTNGALLSERRATRTVESRSVSPVRPSADETSTHETAADDTAAATDALHDAGLAVAKELVQWIVTWANEGAVQQSLDRQPASTGGGALVSKDTAPKAEKNHFPGAAVGSAVGGVVGNLGAFPLGFLIFLFNIPQPLNVTQSGPVRVSAAGFVGGSIVYGLCVLVGATLGGSIGAAMTGSKPTTAFVGALAGGGVAAASGTAGFVSAYALEGDPTVSLSAYLAFTGGGVAAGAVTTELVVDAME